MLQILSNLSMASKKIGTSPSCIQKFLTSPFSPSTNFTPPPPKKKIPNPSPFPLMGYMIMPPYTLHLKNTGILLGNKKIKQTAFCKNYWVTISVLYWQWFILALLLYVHLCLDGDVSLKAQNANYCNWVQDWLLVFETNYSNQKR